MMHTMKKLSAIAWMLVVAVSCLHAQTKFNDLPADYRKVGFPQLVEQCIIYAGGRDLNPGHPLIHLKGGIFSD